MARSKTATTQRKLQERRKQQERHGEDRTGKKKRKRKAKEKPRKKVKRKQSSVTVARSSDDDFEARGGGQGKKGKRRSTGQKSRTTKKSTSKKKAGSAKAKQPSVAKKKKAVRDTFAAAGAVGKFTVHNVGNVILARRWPTPVAWWPCRIVKVTAEGRRVAYRVSWIPFDGERCEIKPESSVYAEDVAELPKQVWNMSVHIRVSPRTLLLDVGGVLSCPRGSNCMMKCITLIYEINPWIQINIID